MPRSSQNPSKPIWRVDFAARGQQGMNYFTKASIILDSGLILLALKRQFELQAPWWICFLQICSFSIHMMDWSGVDYLWCVYQLFGLSFWWHPFTADDPLLTWYIYPNLFTYRNELIYILNDLTVSSFSAHFWLHYSFDVTFTIHFRWSRFKNLQKSMIFYRIP